MKPLYISNAGSRTDFVDKNAVDPIGTLKTDTLHKASLATSVARSPVKYSSLRSKECRLADLRNPMAYFPKDRNNQSHVSSAMHPPPLLGAHGGRRACVVCIAAGAWRLRLPPREGSPDESHQRWLARNKLVEQRATPTHGPALAERPIRDAEASHRVSTPQYLVAFQPHWERLILGLQACVDGCMPVVPSPAPRSRMWLDEQAPSTQTRSCTLSRQATSDRTPQPTTADGGARTLYIHSGSPRDMQKHGYWR